MDAPAVKYAVWALSTPVVFGLGREFFVNAWKQLRHGAANMDTLVAVSTGIAYLFSLFNLFFPEFWLSRGIEPHVYFESAAVIVAFILLGRLLEERAKRGTTTAIAKLMGLQPKTVTVITPSGERSVPVAELRAGDLVAVHPGERIAVDGTNLNYASNTWGSSWKAGFNQGAGTDYNLLQIGGGSYVGVNNNDYASANFNGKIDFITVIDKAYSMDDLKSISYEQVSSVTAKLNAMRQSGTGKTWLLTGGSQGMTPSTGTPVACRI